MSSNLSPQQVKAITLLAMGKSSKEVAKDLGVSPQSVCKWRKSPHFQAQLNTLKWEALNSARDLLRAAAKDAVVGLVDTAKNSKSDETKRKACRDIIELVGLSDPKSKLYGWGLGPTNPKKVIENASIKKAMDQLYKDAMPKAKI